MLLNALSGRRQLQHDVTYVRHHTASPICVDRSHCNSAAHHKNTKKRQNNEPSQASVTKHTFVMAMILQHETKTPTSFHNRPLPWVRRHDKTKAQVIDAKGPEARESTVPMITTTRLTYCACVRASSNGGHARPPSARLSQPRRLCFADSHRPNDRNLPPLSRSSVAVRQPDTATNTGTCPTTFGAARHTASSLVATQDETACRSGAGAISNTRKPTTARKVENNNVRTLPPFSASLDTSCLRCTGNAKGSRQLVPLNDKQNVALPSKTPL